MFAATAHNPEDREEVLGVFVRQLDARDFAAKVAKVDGRIIEVRTVNSAWGLQDVTLGHVVYAWNYR